MADSMMKEAVASTVHALRLKQSGTYGEQATDERIDEGALRAILERWEEKPRSVGEQLVQQYGPPNEGTPSRLIWFNNGPWKRTILYRDEIPHQFPKPHTDLLEQFIDFQVPVDAYDDLAAFDGSVIPERTKGEISARCDMEAMNLLALNLLALNLAHDIIAGNRSIDEARDAYAEIATAYMSGESSPYVEGFIFELPSGETADADSVAMGPMIGEMMEQARSMLTGGSGA